MKTKQKFTAGYFDTNSNSVVTVWVRHNEGELKQLVKEMQAKYPNTRIV